MEDKASIPLDFSMGLNSSMRTSIKSFALLIGWSVLTLRQEEIYFLSSRTFICSHMPINQATPSETLLMIAVVPVWSIVIWEVTLAKATMRFKGIHKDTLITFRPLGRYFHQGLINQALLILLSRRQPCLRKRQATYSSRSLSLELRLHSNLRGHNWNEWEESLRLKIPTPTTNKCWPAGLVPPNCSLTL